MDITNIPIADFYKYCLKDAQARGFKWIVTLVARSEDVPDLYRNLIRSWHSLDSITGDYFLFLFAGKENRTQEEIWQHRIKHFDVSYQAVFNGFTRIINPKANISYKPYDWRRDKKRYMQTIPESHTDAIESLKLLFNISEAEIPCLVFTSLSKRNRYVVPIDRNADNLYDIFKTIFVNIDFPISNLRRLQNEAVTLSEKKERLVSELNNQKISEEERIYTLYSELRDVARQQGDEKLLLCIENRKYMTMPQPLRGKLSKYIDLSKWYEKKNGTEFNIEYIAGKISDQGKHRIALRMELDTVTKELPKIYQRINDSVEEIDSIISNRIIPRCKSGAEYGLFVDIWIPDTGEGFEKLVKEVCGVYYNRNFWLYGRNGQTQNGIDLYTAGFEICVQCKNYQGYNAVRRLCEAITQDFNDAVEYFYPKGMRKYIIATSVRRDRDVQNQIEVLRKTAPDNLDIEILFLEDLKDILRRNPDILTHYKRPMDSLYNCW